MRNRIKPAYPWLGFLLGYKTPPLIPAAYEYLIYLPRSDFCSSVWEISGFIMFPVLSAIEYKDTNVTIK
jgi:hypothetical protein